MTLMSVLTRASTLCLYRDEFSFLHRAGPDQVASEVGKRHRSWPRHDAMFFLMNDPCSVRETPHKNYRGFPRFTAFPG